MRSPTVYKTVHAPILSYAETIGGTFLSREEAVKQRRGISASLRRKDGDKNDPAPLSLFLYDLLDANVREFFGHEEKRERDPIQNHFRTLLYEQMTAKTRVHQLDFSGSTTATDL